MNTKLFFHDKFFQTRGHVGTIFSSKGVHKTPTCKFWYTFVKIALAVEVGQRTRSEMSPCLQPEQHHVKIYVGTKYRFGVYLNEVVPVLCALALSSHKDNSISPYSTQRHFPLILESAHIKTDTSKN